MPPTCKLDYQGYEKFPVALPKLAQFTNTRIQIHVSKRLWIVAILILLIISAVWYSGAKSLTLENIKANYHMLQAYVDAAPFKSVFLFGIAYFIVAALAVPTAGAFSVLGGALFGLAQGTLIIVVAATMGSTVAFLVARIYFREKLLAKYGRKLHKMNENLKTDGPAYLFFLRLNPVIPFFLINTLMGLTPISLWRFVWVSFLGMLPGTVLFVNAGVQLAAMTSIRDVLSWKVLIAFTCIGIFPLVVKRLWRRR